MDKEAEWKKVEQSILQARKGLQNSGHHKGLSLRLGLVRRQIKAKVAERRVEQAILSQRLMFKNSLGKPNIDAIYDYTDNDILLYDSNDIIENADKRYSELSNGAKPTMPFRIDETWSDIGLEELPFFDGRTLRTILVTSEGGKTCAVDDCFAEMFFVLDIIYLVILLMPSCYVY